VQRIDAPEVLAYKPRQLRAGRPDRRRVSLCVRFWRAFDVPRSTSVRKAGAQRRIPREEDLSAEQIGAQAPPWFSFPYGDAGRPEGVGGAPRARAQAAERVIGGLAMGAVGVSAQSSGQVAGQVSSRVTRQAVRDQAVRDQAVRNLLAAERLKRRSEFRAVATGVRAAVTAFTLQALRRADDNPPRVGFTVSKQVGNAVERNRVRRRLREIVRLSAASAAAVAGEPATAVGLRSGHDYVLVGRKAALGAPFTEMMRELDTALARIHKSARAGTGSPRRGTPHEAGSETPTPTRPQPRR
jgi:ribonuclease P protein component